MLAILTLAFILLKPFLSFKVAFIGIDERNQELMKYCWKFLLFPLFLLPVFIHFLKTFLPQSFPFDKCITYIMNISKIYLWNS